MKKHPLGSVTLPLLIIKKDRKSETYSFLPFAVVS